MKPLQYLKSRRIRKRLKSCGRNFIFDPESTFITPETTEIGNDVFIGEKAHITGIVRIGDRVMFGPRPMILSGNHSFGKGIIPRFSPAGETNPIIIHNDVWCGACVIILDGVEIGEGSVIGAGSVVTKSIPPHVVACGNPCRVIRSLTEAQ